MSNNRELKIVIKADGSVAVTELDRVGKEITDLGRTTKQSGDDLKKYKMSWADLATGINQAWEILGKTRRLVDAGWDLSKQGAQLAEARDAFSDYARSVGKSGENILSKLDKASGGTIDKFNLIKTASLAMSLGVTRDADKMANLLQVARNKARLFGIETQAAFEDIVTGIGRASPKILDNLGIRIPAGFEEMTKSMTDTEKVAKLFELTLEEGNKQLDEMGGLTDSRADKIRQFESALADFRREIGDMVADEFIDYADFLREDMIPLTRDWIKELKLAAKVLNAPFQIAATLYYDKNIKKYPETLEAAQQKFYEVNEQITQMRRRMAEIKPDSKPGWYADAVKFQAGVESYLGLNQQSQKLKAYADELETLIVGLDKEKARGEINSLFSGLEDDIKKQNSFIDGLFKGLEDDFNRVDNGVKKTSNSVKALKESYIDLFDATSAVYQLHRKSMPTLENLEGGLTSVAYALEDMIDNTGASGTELLKIPFLEAAEQAAELANNIDLIKEAMGSGFDRASLSMAEDAMQYMQAGMVGYFDFIKAAPQQTSMWDAYGGNILSAVWSAGSTTQEKQQRENLSKIVAEGIQAGFNNADWSNIGLTIGNVLQNVISSAVSAQNPVFSAGGVINWGNLGINLAAGAATSVISGLFTTKEKDKQVVQQAADLKSNLTDAYLETFKAELLPYLQLGNQNIIGDLSKARSKANGAYVGYSSDTGWSWGDLSWVKDYDLQDLGASTALNVINKTLEVANKKNREQEMNLEILGAKGFETAALENQLQAVTGALNRAILYKNNDPGLTWTWTDGRVEEEKIDLSEEIHQLEIDKIELEKTIGQSRARISSLAVDTFTNYMPWLSQMPAANYEQRISEGGRLYDVSDMSIDDQYDLTRSMQGMLDNRLIDPFLLDMVKGAGESKFDLAKLQITDPEEYQNEYLDYLERQMSAYEEVMERQQEIFEDETKTFEERAAALEDFERTMDAYHNTKLDKLRREKQLEEEEKRLMAEQSMAKIEAGLSLVGELSQRGDKVVIIQGGDVQEAIDEMMAQFADNPEMIAILQKAKKTADDKALWG